MSTVDKIINKANMAVRIVAQKNVGQAAITSVREMLRSRVPVGIGEYLGVIGTRKYYQAKQPFTNWKTFVEWLQVKVGIKVTKT